MTLSPSVKMDTQKDKQQNKLYMKSKQISRLNSWKCWAKLTAPDRQLGGDQEQP
jgi:hypothetical protein